MNKRPRYSKQFEYFLRKRENYNILFPTDRILELSSSCKLVPEIILLRSDPSEGDVWDMGVKHIDQERREHVFGITKRALLRIAQAAEIVFDPRYTKRTDSGGDRRRVEYQAAGMLRKPDGQWISIIQSKEIDLDVIESEIRSSLEQEAERGALKAPREGHDQGVVFGTSECSKEISRQVNAKMLNLKKYKLSYAIAGAYTNVIRSLLLIKEYYTKEELAKPFVIPRVSLDTHSMLEDVKVREQLRHAYCSSCIDLYGHPVPEQAILPGVLSPSLRPTEKKDDSPNPPGTAKNAERARPQDIESGAQR